MPVKRKTSKKDITLLELLRGSLAEEAIQGVLHSKDGEAWNPTEALLICHLQPYLYRSSEGAIVRLFEPWSSAARGIGNDELSSALALQAVMTDKWDDWDTVLPELEKRSKAGLVALSDRFFVQMEAVCYGKHREVLPR
jgi:hypothetical protein